MAILLAVFLGIWTWLYTIERDSNKFWLGLVLGIVSVPLMIVAIGFFLWFGLHIWAIVDVATKSDDFYRRYPHGA